MENNSKKYWYSFNSRTRWHRLTFPCSSALSTTKYPGNDSMDNHKMPVKGEKRADCLGNFKIEKQHHIEFLEFSFDSIHPTLGVRKTSDPSFSPNLEQGG